jgi:hypothetical protein
MASSRRMTAARTFSSIFRPSRRPAWTRLPDGAKVTFDIVPNRGKESAENLGVK